MQHNQWKATCSDEGEIVFTTAQKFFPESKGDSYKLLSERENTMVIVDETYRPQYGFISGFDRHWRH